jgi:hypothetical protein
VYRLEDEDLEHLRVERGDLQWRRRSDPLIPPPPDFSDFDSPPCFLVQGRPSDRVSSVATASRRGPVHEWSARSGSCWDRPRRRCSRLDRSDRSWPRRSGSRSTRRCAVRRIHSRSHCYWARVLAPTWGRVRSADPCLRAPIRARHRNDYEHCSERCCAQNRDPGSPARRSTGEGCRRRRESLENRETNTEDRKREYTNPHAQHLIATTRAPLLVLVD